MTRRELGTLGEAIACRHLTAAGYRVLERNFRTRHGELDVVARDARAIVFCEVKTRVGRARDGPFAPLASVGPAKRRQVRRMAAQWLAGAGGRIGEGPAADLRFDAIGVTLDPGGRVLEIEHVEEAF